MTAPVAIRVRARLFAVQREIAGTREVALELPAGASIDAAWTAIVARYPLLAPGREYLRFAVNGEYADPATALSDGDEVAFIPPVSGGQAHRILELSDAPLPSTILADLAARLATPADGAVVGFLGVTRESPGTPAPGQEAEAARHAGRRVESLSYESHESMALRTLEAITQEIEARFGVERLAIVHRTGEVPLGEASVAIVAVAPHRDAAFDAARYAIDETKARAPIWKAERFADGHVWIGEPARTGPHRPGTGTKPAGTGTKPARTGPKAARTRPKAARTGPKGARTGPKAARTGPKPDA
jgi:molybdopterin converting factor subunit 1